MTKEFRDTLCYIFLFGFIAGVCCWVATLFTNFQYEETIRLLVWCFWVGLVLSLLPRWYALGATLFFTFLLGTLFLVIPFEKPVEAIISLIGLWFGVCHDPDMVRTSEVRDEHTFL